jgi:zinc protease
VRAATTNRIAQLLAALALAACAGAKEDSKKPAADTAANDAAQAAKSAAQSGKDAAAGAAQAGKDAAGKVAEAGKAAGADVKAAGAQAASAAKAAVAPEPPPNPDAEFREQKPAPLAVQPHFIAPVAVEKRLKNGARVLISENHALPLVAVNVVFLNGIDAEPIDKAGLAEFVTDTVDEGTKSRPATKLAEEIEDLAALIGASAGRETSSASLNCLTETLPKALELLADIVQNPAFRSEDVERVRGLMLTALQQKKANPGAIAADEASLILYGPKHPWGQPAGGTPETISKITPADLAKWRDAWWVPNNAIISVAGDVKPAEVMKLLEERFANWKARPLARLKLPRFPELKREIVAIDKPGTTQSQVWVIGRLFPARHPDAIPMRIGNMVLGGLFTSRLNMNLRERHGYSYGVRSQLALSRSTGAFFATGGIIAKNTVDSVKEYEQELLAFKSGDVSDEELTNAKEAYVRSLPSALETIGAVAGAEASLVALGLPRDYYRTLPDKIEKVSRKDVERVSKKWMHPDRWPLVIVGPVGKSADALQALGLGPVELRPAPGTTAPTAPPSAPATTPPAAATPPAATQSPSGTPPPGAGK